MVQKTLEEKELEAMHRLEALYNDTEGKCYISFSGGKDSTVLLQLAKMCAEVYTLPKDGIKAVYADTGIEMGVTVDFVKWVKNNWYPNLEIIRPSHSFDWCVKTYGKPIKSKLRSQYLNRWQKGDRGETVMLNFVKGISKHGTRAKTTVLADKDMHMLSDDFPIHASPNCCHVLKKKPFKEYAKKNGIKGYAYGLRKDEGGARKLNLERRLQQGGQICTSISGGIIKKAPIIDWSNADVDEFIKKYTVPLSKAYTEYGFDRTGCMACPFAMTLAHNLKYLHDYEPNRYKAAMHWLKDVYIAQNVRLPFDSEFESERAEMWRNVYEPMRQKMLRQYRPNSSLIKDEEQLTLL